MTYAIETFELSKEFIPAKTLAHFLLPPFQKVRLALAIDNVTIQIRQGEIFCCIILLPLSVQIFKYVIKKAKITGSLAYY